MDPCRGDQQLDHHLGDDVVGTGSVPFGPMVGPARGRMVGTIPGRGERCCGPSSLAQLNISPERVRAEIDK